MANEKSDRRKSNSNFISGSQQLKIDKNFKIYISRSSPYNNLQYAFYLLGIADTIRHCSFSRNLQK